MSIWCQNWVYQHSEAKGNERLVLLAIADEANDDGTNAFPGILTIGHKARLNERTTMRCLAALEASGRLRVTRPEVKGRGHFNVYAVVMEEPPPRPGKGDTVSPLAPTGNGGKDDDLSPFADGGRKGDKRPRKGDRSPRKTARSYLSRGRPIDPLTAKPKPPAAASRPPGNRDLAETLVDTWRLESPAGRVSSRVGVVKIAAAFLDAGFSTDQVALALRSASCPTKNAMLVFLNGSERRSAGDASADAAFEWLNEQEESDGK